MCYDRYIRRHRDEEAESRRVWQDFERATFVSDPKVPEVEEPEVAEPERAEEPVAAGDATCNAGST